MVNKNTDPFGFSEGAKMALAQTHQAMDIYFDFLKKFISAFPSGGTEIGDRWKEQSLLFPIDCNCPCATIAALYPGQNTPCHLADTQTRNHRLPKNLALTIWVLERELCGVEHCA